jgi:hypothetical protein
MKMRAKITIPVSLIIIMFSIVSLYGATIPHLINYNGMLTDDQGNPLNQLHDLTFSIYSDSLGGAALWTEAHTAVTIENGLFSLILGSITPVLSSIFDDTVRYLGITVGSDPELSPRIRLTSVGYAYRAERADTAEYGFEAQRADTASYAIEALTSGTDNDWTLSGDSIYRLNGSVGIGTASPGNKLHITGSESVPLLNVEQTGSFRAVRVFSQNACALWVENAGNHGLRVSNAGGDGIHVEQAGGWAGYFSGSGYFRDSLGIGTMSPTQELDVAGTVQMTGFKMPTDASDGEVLTSNASGVGTWQAVPGSGSNWSVSNSVIYTDDCWGIARGSAGDMLYGDSAHTMVNLGVACTTGVNLMAFSYATVSGGYANAAAKSYAVVGGGAYNSVQGEYSAILGGYADTITSTADYSYLFGINADLTQDSTLMVDMPHIRFGNQSSGYEFPISDGSTGQVMTTDGIGRLTWNNVSGLGENWSVVDSVNYTSQFWGIARGNAGNALYGNKKHTMTNLGAECTTGTSGQNYDYCTVVGGYKNVASNQRTTVCGGYQNRATGFLSTVCGGFQNIASGWATTVGGGYADTVEGDYSFVSGFGVKVASGADYTFAFGRSFTTSTANAVIFSHPSSATRVGINITNPTYAIHLPDNADPSGRGKANAWQTYTATGTSRNVNTIENALSKVLALRGVYFDREEDHNRDIGMIVEEVDQIIPEAVAYEENGALAGALDYARITPLLVEAIKEQQKEIESLKQRVASLETGKR